MFVALQCYSGGMDTQRIVRTLVGAAIVIFGVILLLHNLNIIQFHYWRELWCGAGAIGLCVAGLILLFDKISVIWGSVMIALGVALAFRVFGAMEVQLWSVVIPAVIIGIGLQVTFRLSSGSGSRGVAKQRSKRHQSSDFLQADAFLSSSQLVETGTCKGGHLSAIFGGVDIDLRKADIASGSVLDVFTLCGGVTVILPDNVRIENRSMCILGGVDNKTNPDSHAKKVVYIDGTVILGGIEVR